MKRHSAGIRDDADLTRELSHLIGAQIVSIGEIDRTRFPYGEPGMMLIEFRTIGGDLQRVVLEGDYISVCWSGLSGRKTEKDIFLDEIREFINSHCDELFSGDDDMKDLPGFDISEDVRTLRFEMAHRASGDRLGIDLRQTRMFPHDIREMFIPHPRDWWGIMNKLWTHIIVNCYE